MIQIFPGRSTLQLIVFINNLLEAKGSNKNNVIYLDVRKAFDSVPDSKLLVKSRSYGITGALWRWFQAYLSHHTQYVRIKNSLLHPVNVTSGVPQGSILVALCINDLPSCLTSALPLSMLMILSVSKQSLISTIYNYCRMILIAFFTRVLTLSYSKFAHICFQ